MAPVQRGEGLAAKPLDGGGAGSGDCLIGAHDDAAQRVRPVDRLKRNHHRGGGAVRLADDALVPVEVVPVDLGDDERDLRVHAEGARVVDDEATVVAGDRRVRAGGVARGREEDDLVVRAEARL